MSMVENHKTLHCGNVRSLAQNLTRSLFFQDNEHLSIKCTSSCDFVKHCSQLSKRSSFFPASSSISLAIPRTNRPLLGSQCFKHSWMSVGTARRPTARIRNSRNLSACVENLRSNLFSLIPHWLTSLFLSIHTSAEDLIPSSCSAAFFPSLSLSRVFSPWWTLFDWMLIRTIYPSFQEISQEEQYCLLSHIFIYLLGG